MSKDILDSKRFDGELQSGEETSLTVKTRRGETCAIFVDSGTSGEQAEPYGLDIRVLHSPEIGNGEMQYDAIEKTRAYSYEAFSHGQKMAFDIENVSDGPATYRIIVKSYFDD